MGNYAKAEPLYIEAMNIRKEVLGDKHPSYATSLNNLALLYNNMGNYAKAEPLYIEAMKIDKEVLGDKHPSYALSLNNLAALYDDMGNYAKAVPLSLEAIKIYKEVLGDKHPSYATSLNNLALLYDDMGNYAKAEPLLLEAIKIYKEVLGDKHPSYATSLNNLAGLYDDIGNYAKAEPLYIEAMKIINKNIISNSSFLSENEMEKYIETQKFNVYNFNSFALKRKSENPKIINEVYNNAIINKGILLKSSTAMRTAILNSNDTALISKYNNWIMLKKEISNLYSQEISKRFKEPEIIEQQANVIEKELVRGSQVFSDFEKLQNLTWESVKNNLKQNEAAIEFLRIPKNNDTTIYCALLINADSKLPEMLQLFYEKELISIIGKSEHNNIEYINDIYGTNDYKNEALYNLIWKPMEKQLADIKTIYYSPDGLLNKISFSALSNGKNLFLCDTYKLQQLSSTGKLAMKENENIIHNVSTCLYGGINFATDSTGKENWKFIPGTKSEIDKIEKIFKTNNVKTTSYTGSDAKEEEFKLIAYNNNIIHIATHGFYFNKTEEKNIHQEGMIAFRSINSDFGKTQFVKNNNPLMRSGLVLADANKSWSKKYYGTDNDGILTALEISQLDLHKTQLVVLSACETGLGEIKGSEGVYGLQRAFKMAGVKFIIISLWQVPDKETAEFMTIFYTKLLETKNIRTAFNNTQKEMKQKYDPYFWGAFVLIE